jgi:hypothetical protein
LLNHDRQVPCGRVYHSEALSLTPRIDTAAERIAHQPPQAHQKTCQKANDLAREAVGLHAQVGRVIHGTRVLCA